MSNAALSSYLRRYEKRGEKQKCGFAAQKNALPNGGESGIMIRERNGISSSEQLKVLIAARFST